MKRIFDRAFQYTPSVETDLKKTFARVRKQLKEQAELQAKADQEAGKKVSRLDRKAK